MYHTGKVVTGIKLAIYTYPEKWGRKYCNAWYSCSLYKKQHNIYTQTENYISLTSNADLKLASLSLR